MRIEEIDKTKLAKAPDKELLILRLRFIQLWNKNFDGNDKAIVGSLNREEYLSKYRMLLKEYNEREIGHNTEDIDRAAFKKAMEIVKIGVDVPALGDLVVVPDYISIGGSFVGSPKEAGDIDLVLREDESNRDKSLELKLTRTIQKQVDKDVHFIYAPKGSHSSYIPVFDLVLRAKESTQKVEVKEDYKKVDKGYYEGLDEWSDAFEADYTELTAHLVGDTVLSLGCGTGRLEKRLASIYKVEGVDNNDVALRMCRDKKLTVRKVNIDEDRLPYKSGAFDNVIGIHVLEHLDNMSEVFVEARRVAKKRVIFICPLGERQDKTHKRVFKNMLDFKKQVLDGQEVPDKNLKVKKVTQGDNTVILVLKAVEFVKSELKPYSRYIPPKPTMAHITEAFKFDDIKDWIKDKWPVAVEEKLNGFRCIAEKGRGKVKIWTEGRQDRTLVLPDLVDRLEKIKEDFILDISLGIERKGKPLPRIKLMTLMADEPILLKDDVVKATCFDLPYFSGEIPQILYDKVEDWRKNANKNL